MGHRITACARALVAVASVFGAVGASCRAADSGGGVALFAPEEIEVVDVEATIAIASKAGERLPLVLVHDPAVALAVVEGFNAAFDRTRGAFAARLREVFGGAELDAAAVGEPAFRDFRTDFQKENPLFPVSPALAQSWARGFDGEPVRERIAGLVRAFQRDQLIGEIRPASSVFVVTAGTISRARTWGEVAPRARAVESASVLTLAAAGELLRRMNDPLDRAAGGYLSGLLRPNVVEDRHLTGLLLRERLGAAVVSRRIPRGAKLSDGGRPVDGWAALALEQLARAGIQPIDATPGIEADGEPTGAAAGAPRGANRGWWVAGGLVVVLVVGGACVAALIGRRQAVSVPMPADAAPPMTGGSVIPHLARDLRERLVRALFTQRSVLLANEQAASRRVEEMEERLARLQPAIAERIRGYERRIEALEREIAERDAETRDLLRAKLVLARKELDAEISRSRLEWN